MKNDIKDTKSEGTLKKYITPDKVVSGFIILLIVAIITATFLITQSFSDNDTVQKTNTIGISDIKYVQVTVYSNSGKEIRVYTNVTNLVEGSNYVEFDYTTENYIIEHVKIYNATIIVE